MKHTIILLTLYLYAAINAPAQSIPYGFTDTTQYSSRVLPMGFFQHGLTLTIQNEEEYMLQKSKIDSLYAMTPRKNSHLDGSYVKINGNDNLQIRDNKITVTSIIYPNINAKHFARTSSYDNTFSYLHSNAITNQTTYSFIELINDTFMVYGVETNEHTNLPEIFGSKSSNTHTTIANYYDDLLKTKIVRITDTIILFEGIYYIWAN